MKKRILVTGGAGFIGSHICERLLKEGNYVICCDNFYTGNKNNLDRVLDEKNFEILRHDITFPVYLEIDEIFNFACPASPVYYQNMLGLAKRTNSKIMQASTSEIYGDPEVHPQNESYKGAVSIDGPRACYDEGKRCAETIFWDYKRQHNVDVKVIRIFNTYGPRMQINDGRVVSNFIVQALTNRDITVYGDGSQTRSFCYVDDLVDGIFLMMNKENFPGPINLGNPSEISINELAKEIIDLVGSKSKLINKDLPIDDPKQRCPNIDIAKEKLGWKPSYSRQEGLKKTIKYFETILEKEKES